MAEATEYEVRCPRCNVSFPVGTRTCMHCGGPTARGAQAVAMRRRALDPAPFDPWSQAPESGLEGGPARPLPADSEAEAEPTARGRLLRSGVTVLWIVLAIGFSLVRACSEGNG